MKRIVLFVLTAFLMMVTLPCLALIGSHDSSAALTEVSGQKETISAAENSRQTQSETDTSASAAEQSKTQTDVSHETEPPESNAVGDSFKILNTSDGNVVTVDEREFCYGAVAYEMAPSYEKEALKAQCVACYTHFCRLRELQKSEPDEELKGADFKADLTNHEFYMDEECRKEKWGSLYESSMKALKEAVDECFGEYLSEPDGTPIDAAYFAISSGVTEDSKDIFGFESEHLKAVSSPFDRSAPNFQTTVSVSEQEFISALSAMQKEFQIGKDPKIQLHRTQNGGSVLTTSIDGFTFTGEEMRSAFSLRSTCFSIRHQNGTFLFTVLGYGHNVGMSQYGANEMAKQGANYREILQHYYQLSSDQIKRA